MSSPCCFTRFARRRSVLPSWTIEDIRLLRSMAEQGRDVDSIARALNRSVSAIKNKAIMHGISLDAKRRNIERTVG